MNRGEEIGAADYREITCTAACNRLRRKMPYAWDLNLYRGCEHGCRYCYAMDSHSYLGSEQYFQEIYVKTNIVEALERQLRSSSWKREIINIGGVTDSYQPAEETYRLMPEVLRLLIKYRNPCVISTKSDRILRDFNLIQELSELAYVNVAATITCMDEELRKKIEPNGAPSLRRFAMLKEFAAGTNASTGLHVMPMIPLLTDTRENVDALYEQAKSCGVDYVLPGVLYLRGNTRNAFFAFIQSDFPQLTVPLRALYRTGGADKSYKAALYRMVNEIKAKYGLSGNYSRLMEEKEKGSKYRQMTLFDEWPGKIT